MLVLEPVYNAKIAAYYDEHPELPMPSMALDLMTHELAGLMGESLALEIGAGTGRATKGLLDRHCNLIATDISSAMLAQLRQRCSGARIVIADATALPFPDASFRFVFGAWVLEGLPGLQAWQQAVAEAIRVLEPGGWFIYEHIPPLDPRLVPIWRETTRLLNSDRHLLGLQNPAELKAYAFQLGLKRTQLKRITFPISLSLEAMIRNCTSPLVGRLRGVSNERLAAVAQQLHTWTRQQGYPPRFTWDSRIRWHRYQKPKTI